MLLHFIWIQGSREFGSGERASILSALRNTSYFVVLHTNMEGSTGIEHERFSVSREEFHTTIEGVKLSMANVSDYYRIKILGEQGGMYSDLDMLWVKEVDVSGGLVACYENPSYRTISNAWIYSEAGRFTGLLEIFRTTIRGLFEKGITDVSTNHKYHGLLFYNTRDFLRMHCDTVLPKHCFYKNGWRRIARAFRRAGIPFLHSEDVPVSSTVDALNFDGICAFHFWNSFFPFESLMRLPEIASKFNFLQIF
jgi:hypothetical protein